MPSLRPVYDHIESKMYDLGWLRYKKLEMEEKNMPVTTWQMAIPSFGSRCWLFFPLFLLSYDLSHSMYSFIARSRWYIAPHLLQFIQFLILLQQPYQE